MIIHLYDSLADQVGHKKIKLAVNTIAEAIRALEANTHKMYDALSALTRAGTEVGIRLGKGDLVEGDLFTMMPDETVHIFPVIEGAQQRGGGGGNKSGIILVIGVVLIAAATIMSGGAAGGAAAGAAGGAGGAGGAAAGAAAATGAAGFTIGGISVTGMMMMMGISMVLSGVAGLLMKPPEAGELGDNESKKSYLFTGGYNSTAQGGPIPVFYGGPLKIGSQRMNVQLSIRNEEKDPPIQIRPKPATGVARSSPTYGWTWAGGDVPTPPGGWSSKLSNNLAPPPGYFEPNLENQ